MKAIGVLLLVLFLSLVSIARSAETATSALPACPVVSEKETELDCPWAAIAKELDAGVKADQDREAAMKTVEALLAEVAPKYLARLDHEAKTSGALKQLWGRSINYDENAKGIIVQNAVLDAILHRAGVPARGEGANGYSKPERIAHAGFEHTYGYLLSNLKTPYGYKRLRWVRPDIEIGFGIHPGTIVPMPKKGGLFSNVSYFAGTIAFRDSNAQDKAAMKILRQAHGVADAIRSYKYKALHGRRLTETLTLEGGRTVEIRTDFVPFKLASPTHTGGNTELLIYSIRDSAVKLPYLISAFPIAAGFSDGALNPKNLGENQPIITRYNAFVPGVTESAKPLTGTRAASTF